MRTSLLGAGITVTFVLAACNQSAIDPNADVTIQGSVQRAGGEPVADTGVVLSKEGDLADALSVIASIGIACFADDPPSICDDGLTTKTGPDGSFSFEVKGSFTQGSFGQASTLVLSSHIPRADQQVEGPSSVVRFQAQTTALSMLLKLWGPTVELEGDTSQVRVGWSEFPPDMLPAGSGPGQSTTAVTFATRGTVAWTFTGAVNGHTFDPRLLEDTEGEVSVEVQVQDVETEPKHGSFLDLVFSSGKYRYVSPVGSPPSRGRACAVPDTSGKLISHQPCEVTDGDFSSRLKTDPPTPCPTGQSCPPPSGELTIDMGTEQPVGLVVIRGCPGTCSVQTSSDQVTWRDVGAVQAGDTAGQSGNVFIHPAQPASGRFVRITSAQGFHDLKEVTVWGTSVPAKPAPSGPSLLRRPILPPAEIERRWFWAAAAAVLLLAVVGATIWRANRPGRNAIPPPTTPF